MNRNRAHQHTPDPMGFARYPDLHPFGTILIRNGRAGTVWGYNLGGSDPRYCVDLTDGTATRWLHSEATAG